MDGRTDRQTDRQGQILMPPDYRHGGIIKNVGDIVTVRFEHPEFKHLNNGAITELKLVVKDENNNVVDNHGLPMNCVLEII